MSSILEGTTAYALLDPVSLHVLASALPVRPAIIAEVAHLHGDGLRLAFEQRDDYAIEETTVSIGLEQVVVAGALVWQSDRSDAGLVLASWPANRPKHPPFDPIVVSTSTIIPFVVDRENRNVLIDPRVTVLGYDLDAMLNSHSILSSHPADWVRTLPLRDAVMAGEAGAAEYSCRKLSTGGVWFNHHCTIRRLIGESDRFVYFMRTLGAKRRTMNTTVLESDELVLLSDLFNGMTVHGLAHRRAVTEKTIRNQLSRAYGKIGVGSQTEMVTTFDPPDRLFDHAFGIRPRQRD
ncbi:MAG: hypothetical protein AB8G14_16255 [Ilumatobacter sp.]